MRIDVRQEFIDAGIPADCERCPIAMAVLGDHAIEVVVVRDRIILRPGQPGFRRHAQLPPEAIEFVKRFDERGSVAVRPFEFEVNLGDS